MTEGTQQKQPVDPERESLIAEMLRDAESTKVELPSELSREPVIHRGDAEQPAPMIVHKIDSAGYIYIWDTRTYAKVPVLYYMLPHRLRQRRPDGSYRFTVTDPGKLPQRGTYKCLLHLDDPNRVHYDELGLRTCPKADLNNLHQVRLHMAKKHPAEWAGIEEERKERERQEDRELQRAVLQSVGRGETPKAETPKIVEPEKPEVAIEKGKFYCLTCGLDFGAAKPRDEHQANCKK